MKTQRLKNIEQLKKDQREKQCLSWKQEMQRRFDNEQKASKVQQAKLAKKENLRQYWIDRQQIYFQQRNEELMRKTQMKERDKFRLNELKHMERQKLQEIRI